MKKERKTPRVEEDRKYAADPCMTCLCDICVETACEFRCNRDPGHCVPIRRCEQFIAKRFIDD